MAEVKNDQPDRQHDDSNGDSNFECNICLDTAKDAVVSMCGHLFWFVIV
jgi:E3 ubiquitin-protein ligase RNF5